MTPVTSLPSDGWSRRKVAWLGIALVLPFTVLAATWMLLARLTNGAPWTLSLLILALPFSFIGFGGFILLLVTWITPRGKRPFVDPIRLW
jgi:hypothetical protein